MPITKISQKPNFLSRLFSDEGLTRKAYLNALTVILEYGSRLLVAFILTPITVKVLGNYNYGLWQILNRMMCYLSSTSTKPTQALKWSLANQQNSTDYEFKRSIVGSTLVIWAIFLPIMGTIGGILSWFLPIWLKIPTNSYWQVRLTSGIMVINLLMMNLAALPHSVLQGENLGYKRMGLSALLVMMGGGFTWIALASGKGLVGLATAGLITTTLGGILYLSVVQKCTSWFGAARPSSGGIRKFFKISGWFFAWDLLFNLMIVSDVIILGLLKSVDSVTSYTLTKYAPEMLIGVVAIMISGIIPGLGGIIGSGNLIKASQIRSEIMTISWLVLTFLGATILLWNPVFLQLWVGADLYAGMIPNLLIVIFAIQFALIENDANIINLTLRIQKKVLLGALSVAFCLGIASILVGQYDLGIVGLSLGFILGRTILSVGYPILVSRFLKGTLSSQLKGAMRPLVVMSALFILATLLSENLAELFTLSGLRGWFTFGLSACTTAMIFLIIAFYTGLAAKTTNGDIVPDKNAYFILTFGDVNKTAIVNLLCIGDVAISNKTASDWLSPTENYFSGLDLYSNI
jgi:O-antigen/teichoic acid export membrane protein